MTDSREHPGELENGVPLGSAEGRCVADWPDGPELLQPFPEVTGDPVDVRERVARAEMRSPHLTP
jgi:hypothetical protein